MLMYFSFDCCCKSKCNILVTDTKIYLLVVTLSTQDNAKLLHQLKPGFKRTNN